MSIHELSEYTSVSKYARYIAEKKRRETWDEAVTRNEDMMRDKYPALSDIIHETYGLVKEKRILPSMRAMQFGGKPMLKHNARGYNCLKRTTPFITTDGVKTFVDFEDNDTVTVLTHTGQWKKAKVRCYGKAALYPCVFRRRGGYTTTVWATENHRWLINGQNDRETSQLASGTVIQPAPNIFADFDYEDALPDERLFWAYGYVYGTKVKDKSGHYTQSMVRLCGNDKAKYKPRFEELGFGTSEPKSCRGDAIAYTGHYIKETPDPAKEEPRLIRAFVRGYLDADGCKNRGTGTSMGFGTIQATGEEHINFIRKCFPVAGVYVLGEHDYTGQVTNFGVRPYTIRFNLLHRYSPNTAYQHVETKDECVIEDVWCLEVEDDHSFVLPCGLVTGNCTSSHCDRLRFFQECFYLLLCGCGTGFSVQEHHIAKLPQFSAKRRAGVILPIKFFQIQDCIEGWADAVGSLLSSYHETPVRGFEEYVDCHVVFDGSLVRPAGSPLSCGIGRAPGPAPLLRALEKARVLLDEAVRQGNKLDSLTSYDLAMFFADASVAGGVRRSATICIFSAWDEKIATCKTGHWLQENPQRARSNNSAALLRQTTTQAEFEELFKHTREWGEPGFWWTDDYEIVPNPCFRGSTRLATANGLVRVDELYRQGLENVVVVDTRVGKGNAMNLASRGTVAKTATSVFLTQKNADIYRVETQHGYFVEATANHEFPTTTGRKQLRDLQVGDTLLLQSAEGRFGDFGTIEDGYLLGLLTGDGIADPASVKVSVPDCVWRGTKEFVTGYLRGLFTTDGCVQMAGSATKATLSLRLNQSNQALLHEIQQLLINFGVVSSVYLRREAGEYLLPDGRGNNALYHCRDNYELIINRPNLITLLNNMGLAEHQHQQAVDLLNQRGYSCRKPERYITTVTQITKVATEDVYCLCQPETNSVIANGVAVGQCVEVAFWPRLRLHNTSTLLKDYDGPLQHEENGMVLASGWQMCNLSTINGKTVDSPEEFYRRCHAASVIGTLQATFTDFPYLGRVTEEIVKKEALLGVAICGMMHHPEIFLDPDVQNAGAKTVMDTNEQMAKACGINACARGTCIKPDGKSSAILMSEPGVIPGHAKRYFRVVQANRNERPYQHFQARNPEACEPSVWSSSGTDDCIRFCIESPDGTVLKEQVTAITMLDNIRLTYANWIRAGKEPSRCTHPDLHNNVSNTVTVRPHEWAEVATYLYRYRDALTGVSLTSDSCDRDYAQAPYTGVYTPEEQQQLYGPEAVAHAPELVASAWPFRDVWEAASLALGQWGTKTYTAEQLDWVDMLTKFACVYLGGDVTKATYAVKDMANWQLWCRLKACYQSVDYTSMVEDQDNTNLQGEASCAGGACMVV